MPNTLRVAVIDDHPLFRDGVINMLTRVDDFEVVGQGATAADALKVARELVPDVMLLDLCMPGGGVNAAASIAQACPNVRTVVLTASEDEEDVTSALQAGVKGYILKSCGGHEVVEAVRAVTRGGSYVAPSLAARLLVSKGKRIETVVNHNPHSLTSREEEVFALVSRGMSNKEVARSLKCTDRTVKHHMTNIMQKFNVRNRVQAVLKFNADRSKTRLADVHQTPSYTIAAHLN